MAVQFREDSYLISKLFTYLGLIQSILQKITYLFIIHQYSIHHAVAMDQMVQSLLEDLIV